MTDGLSHLLDWQVPDVRQQLTRERAALYALSIGVGDGPADRRNLDFVDPTRELKIFPSMALVLGYPGFWLGQPETGVDGAQVLHVDQSVAVTVPLPDHGEIVGKTRVLDLLDRGPGRGAILSSERIIYHGDRQIAQLRQSHLIRNAGGFKAQPDHIPRSAKTPDSPADRKWPLRVAANAPLLYRLNGDFNPIHSDPAVAQAAGFKAPINHGMMIFGMVCRTLAMELAPSRPERITAMDLRFVAPSYPGDDMVLEWWREGQFRLSHSQSAVTICTGSATIDA